MSNLVQILQNAGFRGRALQQAWAIAMRESGGNPNAFNGNASTGDKSYGLFQINMLGGLGPARMKQFGLTNENQLLDPATNARVAYEMSKGGTDFGAWGIGPNAYKGAPAAAYQRYQQLLGQFPGAKGSGGSLRTAPPNVRIPSLGGGGSSPAQLVAMQMLQQAQSLAQPGAAGSSSVSNPSSLLAMAQMAQSGGASGDPQRSITQSPGGKLMVANMSGSPEDMRAVKLAEHYLGTPYVYGGDKPGGFDCSGLLQYVWAQNGVNIPRTTYQQWGYGKPVGLNQLQPGDAVFIKGSDPMYSHGQTLPGHVAMYIGNGKVIQAPYTGADVQISPLSSLGPIMGARSFTG